MDFKCDLCLKTTDEDNIIEIKESLIRTKESGIVKFKDIIVNVLFDVRFDLPFSFPYLKLIF